MMVKCTGSGKTLSCKECPHGKPHVEDYNLPAGSKMLYRICFERKPAHQVKCIPVR